MPIANIPVSLEYFNAWYVKEIIGTKSHRLSFSAFVHKAVDLLLKPILSSEAFLEGTSDDYKAHLYTHKIRHTSFSVRTNAKFECPLTKSAKPYSQLKNKNITKE